MAMSEFFGWLTNKYDSNELPILFPIPIQQTDFITTDVVTLFVKILTDVCERTQGLDEEETALLWDNCLKSNSTDGLITMLAKAMANKSDLFIVYDKSAGVIRLATGEESQKIRADYAKQAESSVGIYITFQNFVRADMVKLYSAMSFCTVGALYKSMNLAKAVQVKISDMRGSTGNVDSAQAIAQGTEMARYLGRGRDILMDAKDMIETAVPELDAAKESNLFIAQKLSLYLGLPAAYITGEQTGGLSTTGEGDQKATERGLKNFFFTIMKPVLDAIFDQNVSYKSQDFNQVVAVGNLLKTFSLVDGTLLSEENKRKIINSYLDLPEDEAGDPPLKLDTSTPTNDQAAPGAKATPPPPRGGAGA